MPDSNRTAARRRSNANVEHPRMGPVMVNHTQKNTQNLRMKSRSRQTPPAGIALLICLFVLSLVTVWTVDMLESASVYQSALRNTIEYEQALYQANAGVQHVLSQLETDLTWR